MSTETIIVERDGGVVTVTLNRPERKNAGNGLMWQELYDTFAEVARRREDRVVVVTGAGGAFCSGADIADPSGVSGDPEDPHIVRMQFFGQVMLALHKLPKPTIAKIRGIAAGAGMSLALGCDLTVASDNARFSEIFARRGLSVDGGSSFVIAPARGSAQGEGAGLLRRHPVRAKRRLPTVFSTVSSPTTSSTPSSTIGRGDWPQGPPLALAMTKTLLDNSMSVTMAQALEDEARCQTINFYSEDTGEAMRAFAEKREPRFKGR